MIDEICSELGAIIKKYGEVYVAKHTIHAQELYHLDDPEEYKKNQKKILKDVIRKGLSGLKIINTGEILDKPLPGDVMLYGEVFIFTGEKLQGFLNDVVTYAINTT